MVSQRRFLVTYSLDHCSYRRSIGDNRTVYRQWFKVIGSLDLEQGSATKSTVSAVDDIGSVFQRCPEYCPDLEGTTYIPVTLCYKNRPDLRHGNPIVHRASCRDRESPPCSEPRADACICAYIDLRSTYTESLCRINRSFINIYVYLLIRKHTRVSQNPCS